jgi:uncharacterized protein (TIGR00255 family)
MICSMTGYGRGQADGKTHRITVEVRSVNSRFLDLNIRMPTGWAFEPMVRRIVKDRFRRGRVEIQVRWEPLSLQEAPPIDLQMGKARAYFNALEAMRSALDIPGAVDMPLMASFRDLFSIREATVDEEQDALVRALEDAIGAAEEMRREEGQALRSDLQSRIKWVLQQQEDLVALAPRARDTQISRWQERLGKLAAGQPLDPGRLEQEAAIWMDRLDATEELVRLRSHIEQFMTLLAEKGSVGKRLEFLLQEMHRETNTFGVKIADAPLAHRAVEIKAQIERMREIVQNVE